MFRILLLSTFLFVLLPSCEDDPAPVAIPVSADVELPDWVDESEVLSESFSFRNVSYGVEVVFNSRSEILVTPGLYDVSYSASINGGRKISAFLQNVEIADGKTLFFEPRDAQVPGGLVLKEIFFTGSQYESGKIYKGDQYIIIYNNSDSVIYADGVAILESKLLSSAKIEVTPNLIPTHFMAQAVYVIPGCGTDHPIAPGGSLLICDMGIDHRTINSRSIDLSHADFEWYDDSKSPSVKDIDSESVPNLDKWCCYTNSVWLLHDRGFRAYALARMNTAKEDFLVNNFLNYDYLNVTSAGVFEQSGEAWIVPNEWLLDVVQCSVPGAYLWSVVNLSLDRGFTYCGMMDNDKTRYFKSVCRKVDRTLPNGRIVLSDTNNSSEDFIPNSQASLFAQ